MNPNVTPFRQRVFDACSRVPKGQVTTYKLLAEEIDCGSSQAIGQALKHNPFAPQVPCHRVIATNRTLHGFHGETSGPQLDRKRQLLEGEGVAFDEQGRVVRDCLFTFK